MHDPMTQAFEIRQFWKRKNKWGYRPAFITIWHVDPEKDGSDDSCGWFKRARHGDKDTLERIVKRFEFDWDRVYKSGDGKTYHRGYFTEGSYPAPVMSTHGIVLNLFFLAAIEHFDAGREKWGKSRNKAMRFLQSNLASILLFAENPTDSMHDGIMGTFGRDQGYNARDEWIRDTAACVYGWILREERPWYRHPRWHFWHWKVNIHAVLNFKRWAFSRCQKCGKGFAWGYAPVSTCWDSEGPKWFRSEKYVEHSDCHNPTSECVGKVAKEVGADGK